MICRALPCAAALAGLLAAAPPGDPPAVSRSAYLMGTRVTLAALGANREDAARSLETLLESLEATEAWLSTWRQDTPFARLNAASPDRPVHLDPALCALFSTLTGWRERTGGVFDPAVGPLVDAWGIERTPRVPAADEIARLLPRSRLPAWRFDPDACTVARPEGGRLDSGGFGKGAAIDAAARARVDASGWLIDLGGQVGVHGEPPRGGWHVGLAHPAHRDVEWDTLRLRRGSIATSGGSERDRQVNGLRIGHILDPRTGHPAGFDGSVVVWHEQNVAADVLSTALYIMGLEDGLRWAESNGVAACYLVPRGEAVVQRATSAWQRRPWEQAPEVQSLAFGPESGDGSARYTGVSGIGRL